MTLGLPMPALALAAQDRGFVVDEDGLPPFVARALFNAERTHRYLLGRTWGTGPRVCVFVMLNPSTADAFVLDNTVRRCIGFAKRERCDSLLVLNLFALRSTTPKALYTHPDPVGGSLTDTLLDVVTARAHVVIAGWGAHGRHQGRGHAVAGRLAAAGVALQALAVTKGGHPGHPLYIPADAPLQLYRPAVIPPRGAPSCPVESTARPPL